MTVLYRIHVLHKHVSLNTYIGIVVHAHVRVHAQYDYYINSLRKKKRWSKWAKATAPSSDLELIKEYYNYNEQRAREVLDLLSESEIQKLRLKLSKGGTDGIAITRKTQ